MRVQLFSYLFIGMLTIILQACHHDRPLNYPHGTHHANETVYFTSFSEQPKTLDPAKSYSADEAIFTQQIYEPPLQYAYLKRPYTLEPLTLTQMPEVIFYNQDKQPIDNTDLTKIAYTAYTFEIKPDIYYQPHPAFGVSSEDEKNNPPRELLAKDYVLQIKRLASPDVHSPIYSVMEKYIVGFSSFHDRLLQYPAEDLNALFNQNIAGVNVIDKYRYRIVIQGYHPEFLYWLATPFFAPIPQEALMFYSKASQQDRTMRLDWYPIGTGPYQLTKNDPNSEMILEKNPYFHDEYFPRVDAKKNPEFISYQGKKLPFINKFIFKLEKENIPRWNKFLQGYYDESTISAEQFEQAVNYSPQGMPNLSKELLQKGISLQTALQPSIFYLGFNMKDPVVGGYTERAKLLRQAISIAINYEEFITLFMNGRGMVAQGPIPPDIYQKKDEQTFYNPYIYDNHGGEIERKSLSEAKKLLAEAGYPDGIDPKTGRPLVLNYAAISGGGSEQRAQFEWYRKQFAQLGIDLNIESTFYSRFQDKLRTGQLQLFSFGWHADYPDPENFLFLFYGKNAKIISGGENVVNYENPRFDALYEKLQLTQSEEEKSNIIDQMVNILQSDAPWAFGFHQKTYLLSHAWVLPKALQGISNNSLKYYAISPAIRLEHQHLWNQPRWEVGLFMLVILMVFILPVIIFHFIKEYKSPKRY